MPVSTNTSFLGSLSMPEGDSDAPTMVKVDHVTMVFNIASEQLNSLKEYAIALSRKELRFKEFRALDDVSFEVKQGDVFGILGTNGSGKSTVLKIIAGVLEPTKGSCEVSGSIAPLIELGAGFDMELTARENIFLNGALLGYSKKFILQHFDEIVDFAEVRNFLDMPMKNYSSGMVARIAFAIATVIVPEILIVDEVLSVGDFMFQQKCEQRIQSLIKEHGVTVLIVSHNNDQIERLCNKAAWIEKGHLRAIGSAEEVCELYRAIGGRRGSTESEEVILKLLEQNDQQQHRQCECVYGDDHFGTAIKLDEFSEAPSDTIVLTNCHSERQNRIASALAGALDGAILTAEKDRIPDITAQEIKHRQPNRIIVVGDENQIANDQLIRTLKPDCPNTDFIRIEDSDQPSGIDSWNLAKSMGASWGNTAILAAEEHEASMILLSSYSFSANAPIFYFSDKHLEEIAEALHNFDRLIVVGSMPNSLIKLLNSGMDTFEFNSDDLFASSDAIPGRFQHVRQGCRQSGKGTLVVTSPDSQLDNRLIGPFAGRLNASVVFLDPQNLDSMAFAYSFAQKNKGDFERIVFMGSEYRFSNLCKRLMARAADLQ